MSMHGQLGDAVEPWAEHLVGVAVMAPVLEVHTGPGAMTALRRAERDTPHLAVSVLLRAPGGVVGLDDAVLVHREGVGFSRVVGWDAGVLRQAMTPD